MIVKTLPDITPNGVATALVANNVKTDARWIQLSTVGTTCRYGDSNIGSARGARISSTAPAQIGFGFQEGQGVYDLSQIYVFATGADSISISFGV